MLNIIFWKWRQRAFRVQYTAAIANETMRAVDRAVSSPHRLLLVTDDPKGVDYPTHPLWSDHSSLGNISGCHLPSCYRRLKLFDPATQREMGIPAGERIISVDLDAVVIRDLTQMLDRPERFVGWEVRRNRGKRVMNGSMFMLTAGDLEHVWTSFDPRKSPLQAHAAGFMGSDQGHISKVLGGEPYVGAWPHPDVLSFTRDVVRDGVSPSLGRIIFFAGNRKPWHDELRQSAPWVRQYSDFERIAA